MSHRNFKNSGLRILEAPNGDICITDKGGRQWWKGKGDALFLNAEMMEQAYYDEHMAAKFFRRLLDFVKAHREAREKWHDVPETGLRSAEEEEEEREE